MRNNISEANVIKTLPANIRIGRKSLPGANSLFQKFVNYNREKFYNIGPWIRVIEQHASILSFITTEGATEKVFKSILNRNICFNKPKCYSSTLMKIRLILNLHNYITFLIKDCSFNSFRAAPYRHNFALHKNMPFISIPCENTPKSF